MPETVSKASMDPADLGFGRLFHQIRDAVIVGEAATETIVLWNPAAEKMFGYTEEEALGQPMHFLVPPRLRARHRAGVQRFGSTGEGALMKSGSTIAVPAITHSGREIEVELSLSPLDGVRVPGRFVLAIARDLSTRRPQVRSVGSTARLETLTQLLDDLPTGVFVIDKRNGRPFYANRSALAILGTDVVADVAPEDLSSAYEAYIPGTDDVFPGDQQPIVRALRGERGANAELMLRREEGDRLISVSASPVLEDGGEVRFAVATFDDITARRALEGRINGLHNIDALGQVTAGVAHNFNNLLAIVLSFIDFALEDLPTGSPSRDDLVQARAAAERGASLVANLMSYLRQRPLHLEVLDLSDAITRSRVLLQSLLGSGISLDISDLAPGAWTRFDNGELLNILVNLVANARHSMRGEGELALSVEVIGRGPTSNSTGLDVPAGRFVHLSIADGGPGMTKEARQVAFDPSFKTKDGLEGTGLSLSSVRDAIEVAGGVVDIESEVSVGTTFHIFLPFEHEDELKPEGGVTEAA
jgi:PAS domain S-box-containing protein